MRIIYLVGGFLCLLGMSGCSNNDYLENTDLQPDKKVQMTMRTAGPQTRADYNDNGTNMSFSWHSGDAISVVVNGVDGNRNCQLTASTNAKNAPFSGNVTAFSGTKTIYAFYPYSAIDYTVIGGDDSSTATSPLTLPNPQTYTVGGFVSNSYMVGTGTATALGRSIDASAAMKQVMSIIKLDITKAPGKVKGVKLKCSEPVFPTTATVKLSDGTISNLGTWTNELLMTVTDGTTGTDKAVSFAMFPIDLTGKTISVDVTFEGGLIKTINKNGLAFARNTHYVMKFDATGADPVIEINGLKWATGSLVADGANGAKIGTPTDNGLYFQFGSLIGWNSTGAATIAVRPVEYSGRTFWNSSWSGDPTTENTATGTGDPCKYYLGGTWRLPTMAEYSTLFNHSANWANATGWSWIPSSASAVHTSGLEFPAFGCRSYIGGTLSRVSTYGYYWSSSLSDNSLGCYLNFNVNDLYSIYNFTNQSNGFSVRCVRD